MSGFSLRLKLKIKCIKDKGKNVTIGKLQIPSKLEVSHFLYMGTTRSGKSVTLNQMIHSILSRKKSSGLSHKLIIYDLKGEFVSKWYSEKDILFFPFDKRSIRYSLFNEIRNDIDFKIIAKSLFEPPRNVSQNLSFFYEAGGEIFKTGLILLKRDGKKTNKDILEFFAQDRTKLIEKFKTLPKALQGPIDYLTDSREAAGVLSTVHEKINFLEYLIDCDGPFSFRDYISNKSETRNLFIPNISNYKNIFIPLFSFGIDIMIKEVLSLPDDFRRRVFFLIDEFSSLNNIQSIFDFQRESGSKGGSLICAMQDLGDLSRNYGQEKLQSFFNNFHTKFIFQLLDPNTQDYASRALGERQVHLRMPSHQYSPKDIGDRESISLQNTNERIVMPSEFSLLRNLCCYVQLSNLGAAKIKIPRKFFGFKLPHFMPREFTINLKEEKVSESKPQEEKEPRAYKIRAEKKEIDIGQSMVDY
jgi:type IV secretory pathway TraG/TraD family ATPase VirD4